ncbi:MAG: histidine phosphatase family protein [Gammaproteobacteria bacterium]|nr:MAG: histidine phosphatase family protein [Gammaproteobacteria bacterium]
MDIFLVRHGEAAASWGESSDPGLSELGMLQAERAAQSLRELVPGDIQLLSSPLARARETAAPLAKKLELPVRLCNVFREIPAAVPLAQRQSWLRQFMQQHWGEQPEHLCEWRAAASQQLLDLRQPAVVFSHFLVINAIVGQVLGRTETLCFRPDNGSITRLRHTGTSLELVALGEEKETVVY